MRAQKVFDGLLVREYQTGNKKALDQLVKRYHRRLCKHAYWYVKDIAIAQDVVQDSWKVILNKLDSLREPNSFGSWAMRIVSRKALNYLKSNSLRTEKLAGNITYTENTSQTDERESSISAVKSAIAELPLNQQIVLKLFYTQEHSLKEISAILEISVGTVKSRLYNAREKLKLILNTKI